MKIALFLTILVILGLVFTGSFFVYNQEVLSPTSNQSKTENEQNIDKSIPEGDVGLKKQVKVDLSQQKAFLFEAGELVKEYNISSGLAGSPTPTGEYKIVYKQEKLYSKIAECWLSYWVGFTKDGLYGFHETPVCDGIRQGEDNIGKPASHGCLRLKMGEAVDFYNWAEIGMPIEIY